MPIDEMQAPIDARAQRQALWSGILFGVGTIAFVDEAVFHQLLHWHHFYDLSTTNVGLVSDGVFHAVSWAATIGGLFLLADLRRRHGLRWSRWWGGMLLGAGAFQLYDGTVHHLVLGIHQIRSVPDTLPYDVAWNAAAIAMLVAGSMLTLRSRASRTPRV